MAGRLVKGQIGVIAGGGPLASGAMCSPEIYEIACPEVALWPEAGGITIGLLPTSDNRRWPFGQKDANPYCDLVIPTGLGHARNVLVVHASDALIAVAGGGLLANGEAGTLSEIAIALPEVALRPKLGKPIVGIKSWELEGRVPQTERGDEAVVMLMEMLG